MECAILARMQPVREHARVPAAVTARPRATSRSPSRRPHSSGTRDSSRRWLLTITRRGSHDTPAIAAAHDALTTTAANYDQQSLR